MVLQAIFWNVRLVDFMLSIIILELYMSFQIPEKRFDTLTGLQTRSAFINAARHLLAHAGDKDFVLVYSNVLEFKAINEIGGPDAGDKVLLELSRVLKDYVGEYGTCARMQSDHFAFCMPAERFNRERLLDITSSSALREKCGYEIQVTYGVYDLKDADVSVEIMCDRARLATYSIGGSHLERLAFYKDELGSSFINGYEISAQMEKSLQEGRFEVYLQPVYDLATVRIVAAEALIRWNHPERGYVLPGDFIPLFERNGLISKLDRFVWETACHQLRIWTDKGIAAVPISVNISRSDLTPDLDSVIESILNSEGIAPRLLLLEITESVYMEKIDLLTELIDNLHARGSIMVLDDFGTGYSSLGVLEDAPFDRIKLDRAFLADILSSERSRTVVRNTVRLSGELGLPVLAEGVESREQADMLREMGAQYAQGFYFSKPVPISQFEEMLLEQGVK